MVTYLSSSGSSAQYHRYEYVEISAPSHRHEYVEINAQYHRHEYVGISAQYHRHEYAEIKRTVGVYRNIYIRNRQPG